MEPLCKSVTGGRASADGFFGCGRKVQASRLLSGDGAETCF
ncbi:MAG: hypothetical protein ABIB93_01725 [Chloroflexota bacterium]